MVRRWPRPCDANLGGEGLNDNNDWHTLVVFMRLCNLASRCLDENVRIKCSAGRLTCGINFCEVLSKRVPERH